MRHRTSPSLFDLWRRLPRAVAGAVVTLAELSPVRAVMVLAVTLGFGTSAAVSVASVGGTPVETAQQPVLTQRPLSTASRDAERPDVGGQDVQTPQGSASSWASPQARHSHSPLVRADKTGPDKTRGPSPRTRMSPAQSARTADAPWAGSSASSTPSGPSSPSESGGQSPDTSADSVPPETSVRADFPQGDSAVFTLSADEPATYACTLDGSAYDPCESPARFSDLHPGWHVFEVRAIDDAGNVDPTPAEVRWHANAGSAPGGD